MKVLVTGADDALARMLIQRLERVHARVTTWCEVAVPPLSWAETRDVLDELLPDVVYHLAPHAAASRPWGHAVQADPDVLTRWSVRLAAWCRSRAVVLVLVSSVAVFSKQTQGPFGVNVQPDATEGWGHVLRTLEQNVLEENSEATLVRLGRLIGDLTEENPFREYLERSLNDEGILAVSRLYLPSCSMLADTASTILSLGLGDSGVYHLNANQSWSLYDIAWAMASRDGVRWKIMDGADGQKDLLDRRMLDPRLRPNPLETALPELLTLSPPES